MTALELERGSFAGHETFPFRFTWLRKAVLAVTEDGEVFRRDDAMVRLGVGKNMVRSIHHWALACGMVEEDPDVSNNRGRVLRPTRMGAALLGEGGWDEYLEDPTSLWLLHWHLCSKPTPATTWYWTFNQAPQLTFTKAELVGWLGKLVEQQGWTRAAESSLRRDVDCFLHTYVATHRTAKTPIEDTLDCPLVELGLVRESTKGSYVLVRGDHPTLSDGLFAYALADYLRTIESVASTIPLESVAFRPGAPGRVFSLTEEALLQRLERIDETTDGQLAYDETAGLRQVFLHRLPPPEALLEKCFATAAIDGRAA